jgi:hypothetical protein
VTEPPPPAQATEDTSARNHDGFFFRMGLGVAYANAPLKLDGEDAGKASGFGASVEFLFGGTPAPGLVIGGGLIGHSFPSPTLEDPDGNEDPDFDGTLNLSTVDLFVNFYPDPKSGFQIQGLVGFAVATLVDDNGDNYLDEDSDDFSGPVVGAGIGFDGFVSDQWSLGVMGRVLYAPVSTTVNVLGTDVDADVALVVPSVSFIATLH